MVGRIFFIWENVWTGESLKILKHTTFFRPQETFVLTVTFIYTVCVLECYKCETLSPPSRFIFHDIYFSDLSVFWEDFLEKFLGHLVFDSTHKQFVCAVSLGSLGPLLLKTTTQWNKIWAAAWQKHQNDLCIQWRLTSLGVCPVWSVLAMHSRIAKDPAFLHADNKLVRRLSDWVDAQADLVFTGHTYFVAFFMLRLTFKVNICPLDT